MFMHLRFGKQECFLFAVVTKPRCFVTMGYSASQTQKHYMEERAKYHYLYWEI